MIESLSKQRQKELIQGATELFKSGAVPNPRDIDTTPNRARVRQAQRAEGNRGAKTRRHNPAKHQRRVVAGKMKTTEAILLDEGLQVAKDRVEHPIRSRIRARMS